MYLEKGMGEKSIHSFIRSFVRYLLPPTAEQSRAGQGRAGSKVAGGRYLSRCVCRTLVVHIY